MRYSICDLCWLVAFGLFISPAAYGADEVETQRLFTGLDANQDGQIERAEVSAQHARLFTRLLRTSDVNQDGQLSTAEFHQSLQPQLPAKPSAEKQAGEFPGANALLLMLNKMDANGDRTIVQDEVPAPLRAFFNRIEERLGGERDGRLAPNELVQAAPQLAQLALRIAREMDIDVELELALLPEKEWRRVQAMAGPNRRGQFLANPEQALQLFRRLDTDSNGQITLEEIPSALADRFERLMLQADRNDDNQLSQPELLALSQRMRAFEASRLDPEQAEQAIKRLLKQFDRNGDQQLSRNEAPRRMANRFDRLDTDGSGALERSELGRVVEMLRRLRGPEADVPGKKGGKRKAAKK
ncbi:MAG: hypothetical protein MI725_05555 [Pirellulales bacterium]|nr:hypothetical protein [Pirellulales bacterium]